MSSSQTPSLFRRTHDDGCDASMFCVERSYSMFCSVHSASLLTTMNWSSSPAASSFARSRMSLLMSMVSPASVYVESSELSACGGKRVFLVIGFEIAHVLTR